MTLTREQIYTIIREFNCGDAYDAYERANQATDEIWDLVEPTALLPGRCAPTEEEIARRLHRADCDCPEPGAEDHGIDYAMLAEDVLALFAAQPTVAKAKAEGWDEGWVSATVAMARALRPTRTARRRPAMAEGWTTKEVRRRYVQGQCALGVSDAGWRFDRWLAAHDAEVAAKALDEAARDARAEKAEVQR